MADSYCCTNCFNDPGLTRNIIPKVISDGSGLPHQADCDFCGAVNVTVIDPSALSQWFEMLLDCYSSDENGSPLTDLLAEDWHLFNFPSVDTSKSQQLLATILGDETINMLKYSPIDLLVSETPQRWDDLRDEMMHRNRWFLDEPIDLEHLAELLEQLIAPPEAVSEITDMWHRSRLLSDDQPLPLEEMGAPPSHLAGHGRANPAGIRYLYLGSTAKTAVAEIRPHTGEKACVATFKVPPSLVVDLRDPRQSASPFILENAEQIAALRAGLPLLERLGEELTKPVQPSSAAFEYIPSQYLCEFIKKSGYEGVIYRSSVSDGVNLALFNPEESTPVDTHVVLVDKITVEFTGVN